MSIRNNIFFFRTYGGGDYYILNMTIGYICDSTL